MLTDTERFCWYVLQIKNENELMLNDLTMTINFIENARVLRKTCHICSINNWPIEFQMNSFEEEGKKPITWHIHLNRFANVCEFIEFHVIRANK